MNLKLAFRRLFKTPFVSAVAILSLALGIGANAAIFSLFDQTLLRALPVAAAARAGEPLRRRDRSRARTPAARPATASRCSATRCSAISRRAQTGLHRHRGTRRVRREPGVSRVRPRSGDGMLVSGLLLSGARPAAGARPPARCQRRSEHRRPLRHRAEPCLLDDAARRQTRTSSTARSSSTARR